VQLEFTTFIQNNELEEQIMSKDKYASTVSCHLESIEFIILQICFATCEVLTFGISLGYSPILAGSRSVFSSCDAFRVIACERKYLMGYMSNYSRILICSYL